MSSAINLSQLPPPQVIEELDFEELFEQRKARLLELTPEADRESLAQTLSLESEPLVKLLQENAYRELVLRQQHNERAKSLMLAYAKGSELDHIGATYYMTPRLTLREADPDATPPVAAVAESDADYLRRLLLAHDAFSTAGSRAAYRYFSLSADPKVKDADAIRPLAGVVQVYVLSREGDGEASPDLISAVDSALNEETVRPLTDFVRVTSATILPFEVVAELEIESGPGADAVIQEAEKQVHSYVDERHKLNQVIVPGALEASLYVAGVRRAKLISPTADIGGDPSEAPYCQAIEIAING